MQACAVAELLSDLDATMARLNIEYQAKRTSARLRAPRLYLMKEGWHQAVQREQMQADSSDVQFKWKTIVERPDPMDADYIEQVVEEGYVPVEPAV